jgi:hypothetical protein
MNLTSVDANQALDRFGKSPFGAVAAINKGR